jgi:hypothetical protein
MELDFKVLINRIKKMEKENFIGQMEMHILVNLLTIKDKDMEL